MNSGSAAERLYENKQEVLEWWERQSRKVIESARDKDSHTVRDELSLFLSALVENLRAGKTNVVAKEKLSAEHHGQQRAGLTGYTLMETVKEYGILRKVLISLLLRTGSLLEIDREVIHETVDNAIQLASNEFARAEQAKIKLALAKAESSNRELEQFAAVAAHDLRSPLNSIAGFAEILQTEYADHVDPKTRQCLTYISKAVKRMTKLIEGILSYAKLDGNPEKMKMISADDPVNAAIQNLKAALTRESGRVGHEKLPMVFGDMTLLTQLFQNLFSNAIRYRREEPPEIEVSSAQNADQITICVADNGIGFDMNHKELIFEVHKQLDSNPQLEGSGLGLATCRRVVEHHGGKIWAESVPGKGSRFYFTLPRCD